MTAQRIVIPKFGPAHVLAQVPQPRPQTSGDQVLVRVHAAAVNPIDVKTRAGLGWAAEQNRDQLPWCPGYDLAGEVVEAPASSELQVGDAVCGMVGFPLRGGAYAGWVLASADELVRVPPSVSLTHVAALPLAGLTALQGLEKLRLQPGERLLITGAGGGVGLFAVQLARLRGVEVIAVASAAKHDLLNALGADACIDYHLETARCQPLADAMLDLVGGDAALRWLSGLRSGGRLVTVPTITRDIVVQQAEQGGLQAQGMLVAPDHAQLEYLIQCHAAGQLQVHLSQLLPLSQAAEAHGLVEQGHTVGKVVLTVAPL